MGDIIDLQSVSVIRGSNVLLDSISWEVNNGERWVILGPNGAGKTTLISVVATTIFPTHGTASVLGQELGKSNVFDLRTTIGVASSALADRIPDDEKVTDVVRTGAYAQIGRWREAYAEKDDNQAASLLNILGVAALANRPFGTLSEGERKRVQIARALMPDPELLLLDEPTAGLDVGAREVLVHGLHEIISARNAPVVVMVTHHVEEIPPGFSHAMLLRKGDVMAAGPIEYVLTEDLLSATFGVKLSLDHRDGRWWARAV